MIVQFQIANVGQYFVRTDWIGLTPDEVTNLSHNGRLAEERRASVKAEVEYRAHSLKHIECVGRG